MAGIQGRGLKRVLTAIAVVAVLGGLAAGPAGARSSTPSTTAESGPRVIGGQPAAPGQFPWLVAVVDHAEPRPYEGQFCGGTVVAPNWVLTAWHCVVEFFVPSLNPDGSIDTRSLYSDPARIDVVAGAVDLTKVGGERVQAAQIVPFPSAGLTLGSNDYVYPLNDAALIRLKAPLSAPPVRLASTADGALAAPPAQATVAGWGTITDPGNKTEPSWPPVANFASVPIVGDAGCTAGFGTAYVKASHLCAGAPGALSPGEGACYGDSGGPLAGQDGTGGWVQIGIVSFGGETCASSGTPGVYARVSNVSDWVRTATGYGPFAGPGPFVGGQLRDFTNKAPSLASIQTWMQTLGRTSPSFVIRHLAAGPAWQRTAGTTDRLYRAAFGRSADTGAMLSWTARLAAGAPESRLADTLVSSSEFRLRFGQLDDDEYVDHLYRTVLGTSPDPANRALWLRRLRNGTTRGEVLATFAAQPAFTSRIAADTQIAQIWFGMLRTAPNAAVTARWRGRSDELVRRLLTNPTYIGRTWRGINDTDYSDVDIDFEFEFSAASSSEQVQRIQVHGRWPAIELRAQR